VIDAVHQVIQHHGARAAEGYLLGGVDHAQAKVATLSIAGVGESPLLMGQTAADQRHGDDAERQLSRGRAKKRQRKQQQRDRRQQNDQTGAEVLD
jgi:hypothetical protein